MLHEYGTLDEVKSELSWLVTELKCSTFKGKTVPFLTEGADLGSRNIIGKGMPNYFISPFYEPFFVSHFFTVIFYQSFFYQSFCFQANLIFVENILSKSQKVWTSMATSIFTDD